MSLATNSAKTALSLLTKFGQPITFERVTAPGTYDVTSGKTSAPTTETVTVQGYAKDLLTLVGRAPNMQINAGDQQVIIAASSMSKPSLDDTMLINGEKYVIVPLQRGGMGIATVVVNTTAIIYKIHGRRS